MVVDSGDAYVLDLTTIFGDSAEDTLSFSHSVHDPDEVLSSGYILDETLYLYASAPGSATVTLTARDESGAEIEDRFILTVNPSGQDLKVAQPPGM